MIGFIYSALAYLLMPFVIIRLLWLSLKHSGYRQQILQRFAIGLKGTLPQNAIWLHAVSVGEVIGSETLVKALLQSDPKLQIVITNTTPTGAEQVGRSFSTECQQQRVWQCLAPYDLPDVTARFINALKPKGLLLMETEIWPNWVNALYKRQIPLLLVNARLSQKSAKRYAWFSSYIKTIVSKFNLICVQSDVDYDNFARLGASNVQMLGNLKADFILSDSSRELTQIIKAEQALPDWNQVIIAASTHRGEDLPIIQSFANLHQINPKLRLILVPRHPDRANEIAGLLSSNKLGFQNRSLGGVLSSQQPVLLADKLGELRSLYGLAHIAIIGGTLIDHGGHNPLEPAAWSCALVAGPSQRNFNQLFNQLESKGAMLRVQATQPSLQNSLKTLLDDSQKTETLGAAANSMLLQSRGATGKTLRVIEAEFGLL